MFGSRIIFAKDGSSIKNGDSIRSESNPDWIYRFEDGKKRHYPNPEIASSWDKNWMNAKTIKSADWQMIPMGIPMSKPTGFIAQVIATQNSIAPNPLSVPPLAPTVVAPPTTPRTADPSLTAGSGAVATAKVVDAELEEKLLGLKKPMAYYVYGGGLLLLIVIAVFMFKK